VWKLICVEYRLYLLGLSILSLFYYEGGGRSQETDVLPSSSFLTSHETHALNSPCFEIEEIVWKLILVEYLSFGTVNFVIFLLHVLGRGSV
jgi:hypothetical protein